MMSKSNRQKNSGHLLLIMAQGAQSRWDDDGAKHLALFCGETILSRVCRLALEYMPDADRVVIGWPAYYEECDKQEARILTFREPGREFCNGVKNSHFLWARCTRVTILCGDVVYSRAAMKAIANTEEELRFFGRIAPSTVTTKVFDERFGLTFTDAMSGPVISANDEVLADADCIQSVKSLYQTMIGAPRAYHDKLVTYSEDKVLYQIDDFTDDFDRYLEYTSSVAAVEAAIVKEEKEHGKES